MAAGRSRDILLKIVGDGDDARRELRETAREVAVFDGVEAEAELRVDADQARRELAETAKRVEDLDGKRAEARIELQARGVEAEISRVQERLERLSRQDASPKVDIAIAKALTQVERLELKLAALDAQRVEPEVGVDTTEAERETEAFRAQLQAVAELSPVAKIDLESRGVQAELERVRAHLATLSAAEATPEVDVDVAKAVVQITRLEAKLAALDARRVDVNVDVDRQGTAATGIAGLIQRLFSLGSAAGGAGGDIGGVTSKLLPFGAALNPVMLAVFGLVGVIGVALVAALGAMVASLGAAVTALGALAVAAGGGLVAAFALGAGVVSRFSATSGTAGTAAHALAQAFGVLGRAYTAAIRPASIAIFRGLTAVVNSLKAPVTALQPAFTMLGRSIAQALISNISNTRALVASFGGLVTATAPLAGPVVSALTSLLRILVNIATAAMPTLVAGAQRVAAAFDSWAASTDNIEGVRTVIDGLVGHLSQWWTLIKQVASLTLGFFRAAAPAGQGLVKSLSDGAASLAKWVNSAAGQAAIKQFFVDIAPLVKSVGSFLGQLVVFGLRFTQAFGPALVPLINQLTTFLGAITKVITKLGQAPGVVARFGAAVTPAGLAMTLFGQRGQGSLSDLIGAFTQGKAPMSAAARGIGSGALSAILSFLNPFSSAGGSLAQRVITAFTGKKPAGATAGRGLGSSAVTGLRTQSGPGGSAGAKIAQTAITALTGKRPAAGSAGKGLGAGAAKGISGQVPAGTQAGGKIGQGAATGVGSKKPAAQAQGRGLGGAVIEALRVTTPGASGIGRAVVQGFIGGLGSMLGSVRTAAAAIGGAALSAMRAAVNARSPSEEAASVGEDVGAGFVMGMDASGPAIGNAVARAMERVKAQLETLPENARAATRRLKVQLTADLGRLEAMDRFQTKIYELGQSFAQMARQARDAFIEARRSRELAGIDSSKEARQLSALEQQDADIRAKAESRDLQKRLVEAKATGDVEQIKAAEEAIAAYKRQKRMEELRAELDSKRKQVEGKATLAKNGMDQEVNGYEAGLLQQMNALRAHLADGTLEYKDFVSRLMQILPAGITFEVNYEDAKTLSGGRERTPRTPRTRRTPRRRRRMASGGVATGATDALIGEGRYREAVLPLSGAVMRTLAKSITDQMRVDVSVPTPQIGALALAGGGGGAATTVHREGDTHNWHPPATPDHGLDPDLFFEQVAAKARRQGFQGLG